MNTRRFLSFFGPVSILVVAGFNFRHQWPPQIHFGLQIAGIVIALLGCLFAAWALASNKFFLRIHADRQRSRPYHMHQQRLRHPGYLGAVLIDLATPLILNSVRAFIPAVLTLAASVARTALEDKALQDGLEGYKAYTHQVRYRLIPAVW